VQAELFKRMVEVRRSGDDAFHAFDFYIREFPEVNPAVLRRAMLKLYCSGFVEVHNEGWRRSWRIKRVHCRNCQDILENTNSSARKNEMRQGVLYDERNY
jgi:hypothetical protein